MTDILRPDGQVLSTVKRSHDSDRVMARRQQVSKELGQCIEGYRRDMTPDPSGAAPPNEPAVYEYWDERWRSHCQIVQKSSEPVEVDPEAFARLIQDIKERDRRSALEQLPISLLTDEQKKEYDLHFLGVCAMGEVYMANRFAIVVDANGAGYLHLPDVAEGDDWPQHLLEDAAHIVLPFQMKRNGMNLQCVAAVLAAMGIKQWAKPSAKQILIAGLTEERSRRWWQFWKP